MLRSAKNIVKGYSDTEVLVRDATANNSTNPSRELLDDLADKSYNSVEFFEILDMLDKRINDKGKYWRHVAKALTVLDYLVRFGSENCVIWCQENLYIIKTLREFSHEDAGGEDEGKIIRVKAKELTSLLMDEERLKEERAMNIRRRGGPKRRSGGSRERNNRSDEDLQRAIEESKRTAEEEERRRRNGASSEADRQAALQLSREEEDLRRLQEQARLAQQQQQQQQQQPMYYDVFGNPITPEEYLQFQQQQALLAQQQQQQAALEQQYWAQQQQNMLAQQQQQQQPLYGIQQQTLPTGSNNPFALNNATQPSAPASTTAARPAAIETPATQTKPLTQTRSGNQAISDKYSALNNLLASGTGIDTFGNTGEQRIPAQHTQTGTFINSQGTGYRQVNNDDKPNPFLNGQYTGLPSTNIVPTQTGFGFGNQANSSGTNNNNNNNGTLVDL
ncbi:epsin KNAG_0C03800 [Huiozyma naganishii CBS 8797]|uniref:ENTH domain-containing protein n=1 Tax=Huiozyma naganishii (strain ATCC MYA-139 / BCRC 22969 / CBS 8797 / KCTC 17520 / NBRC 10181 / NCYC 3082 / Yp74L-3) TaxID=1071383 RepID=J7S4V9_HUIN7|nr:hypothetical protein KNAG_0C03800 [Kazachstania naganishii CBS 8797]CCK69484.1 hypothetical protein KNAG_0C03800 [Kazachstania naganishii CBS 8797]